MKIYLDNNLGVTKVEQEELTQDTYGYNILKVYIPNAVLTPYDTFTCYYGALLQNGRKVGWFAMEARTSTDADYEKNYTLYKATLEQCVVSVEGKVYIGCQVLLGNRGNATLIKKNTAVVQFNVRKSVAINNDILVLDSDQTNTDVLESYKNLLEKALTTYVTKASIADNLKTNDSSKVLSAKQGYILKIMLDALDVSKADKSNTYTKAQTDNLLNLKADKSDTYTKTEVDEKDLNLAGQIASARVELDNKINNTNTQLEITNDKVTTLQDDVADLKSVQNVVEVVATKSALNSYDTSKLEENDKVQVIADETHDGASTIYNWNGSAWVYVGAFGGNSYTKAETYNKTQIDSALSDKADKSNTYTRTVIDSMILTLSTDKADKSNTYTKTEIDNTMQEVGQMFEIVGNEVLKRANAEYISKGTTLTQTSYSNTNPAKSTKVVLSKVGGMSYKVNGTIQHSAVTEIRSKNGNTIVNSLSIPSYIRNIEGYGWGIDNTCYNYIDFATKKFVQKVGCVVLNGTESGWEDRPNYTYADRFVLNASGFLSPSEKGIVNWAGFEYIVTAPTTYPYVSNYNGHIMVNFSAKGTTTLEQFKEYLGTNNLIVYYELATPIETDISEYLTTDTLECIEGGTLKFLNTYNQAVPNEIAYLFNAVTLNNIVDSNGNTIVIATKQELNDKITELKWELGSHTLDVTTDTDTSFSKSVPSGALGCQINKVGSMSYKSANLINYQDINSPKFTDLGNGSFTLNWGGVVTTITLPYNSFKDNTQYSVTLTSISGASWWAYNLFWNYSDGTSERFTNNQDLDYGTYSYTSAAGKTLSSITWQINFEANFKDLMLNVGTPFDGIRNSAVTSVVSKDSNDTTIDTLTIPTAIQNLTGYGWGINDTCYNYIDFENKKFIKKVGRVDLGSLNYTMFSVNEGNLFRTNQLTNVVKMETLNLLVDGYTPVLRVNRANKTIYSSEILTNTIDIIDNDYSTPEAFKTAMSGVYLYYEFATPVETDISAYLTTDTIDVEPNGTLEFTNTYSQDVPSDIDYLIEEVKA